jgi:hypothetical protein
MNKMHMNMNNVISIYANVKTKWIVYTINSIYDKFSTDENKDLS